MPLRAQEASLWCAQDGLAPRPSLPEEAEFWPLGDWKGSNR